MKVPGPSSFKRRRGHAAALAILTHNSLADAAASLNLATGTLVRWGYCPWFQDLLDATRRELLTELVRQAVAEGKVTLAAIVPGTGTHHERLRGLARAAATGLLAQA